MNIQSKPRIKKVDGVWQLCPSVVGRCSAPAIELARDMARDITRLERRKRIAESLVKAKDYYDFFGDANKPVILGLGMQ